MWLTHSAQFDADGTPSRGNLGRAEIPGLPESRPFRKPHRVAGQRGGDVIGDLAKQSRIFIGVNAVRTITLDDQGAENLAIAQTQRHAHPVRRDGPGLPGRRSPMALREGVILGVALALAIALIGAYFLLRSGLIPANADAQPGWLVGNLDGSYFARCNTASRGPKGPKSDGPNRGESPRWRSSFRAELRNLSWLCEGD